MKKFILLLEEIIADNRDSKQSLSFALIFLFLLKIKEETLAEIRRRNPIILDSDVEWKVTVPAIWKNESKDIMRRAAQEAGIFNSNE